MGQAPSGASYNYEEEGLPLIAGFGDIVSGQFHIKKWTSQPTKICQVGDLIIGVRATLGANILADRNYCLGRGVAALRPNRDVDIFFLRHWMNENKRHLLRVAKGSTFLQVTKEDISQLEINLPPLKEQKRIATILDQAEELKQKRQRSLELLDELKQAIFIDMFGDPDTNPHNFQRKKLGEIINFVGGSQPSKANFVYEHNEGLVRLVQIRDFKSDKNIVYVPAHLAKRPFSTEDIMIGRYGPPVFQILRGLSGTYNVALMKAEPIDDISKEFIYYLLKEPRLHNFVVANSERTAGQSGVNLKLLNEYPAYLPPKDVQTKFDAKIANVSKLEESIIQSSHLSEELFTSLQHKAFSGELSGAA
jgi:type I restriction enzyme S subunit